MPTEKRKAYNKKYYELHKEKEKLQARIYYKLNKYKCKANMKIYAKENPEKINKINKIWQLKNPEKLKLSNNNWNKNNTDKCKKYKEKWYSNNYEEAKERMKIYNKTPQGKISKRKSQDYRKRHLGSEILNYWFPTCNRHHINKNQIICIPKELHDKYKGHALKKPESMIEINREAFKYLTNSIKQI